MKQRALEGIKVIDLSRVIAGPHCTQILGDFGADIIKVEKKDTGDISRVYGPFYEGESTYFMAHNRNKRSVTLDFRHKKAKGLLLEMLKDADVLVENFKAGTLENMGLNPDELLKANPRLIITRLSGFGQDGPYQQRMCYDAVGQALSGLMSINGSPEGGPVMMGLYICDFVSGIYGAVGTLAALQAREKTGKGQVVDVGLLDAACGLTHNAVFNYYQLGLEMERTGNQDRASWPANFYPSKDGDLIYIHAGLDDSFARFCRMSGNEALLEDERYNTLAGRARHIEDCDRFVGEWAAALGTEEVGRLCTEAKIPYAKVNSTGEMARDPQLLHRGMVRKVQHPQYGEIMMNGPVVKMSDTPPDVYAVAPTLGQHNREVYKELLHLTDEEIDAMEAEGLV